MDKFTNKELEIISDGLLCLIGNAGKARGLLFFFNNLRFYQ